VRVQRIPTGRVVRATSSAAIANVDTAGGRLIPLVMIDASEHPEIRELIRAHKHTPAGDCVSQWATPIGNPSSVHLRLEFIRPVATSFIVEFELPKLAGAIDNILRAKSMFLLEGKEGSTFTSTEGQPRILMEMPSTGFEPTWERIFRSSLVRMFRDEGASRRLAKVNADRFVARWRAGTTFDL